jgi:hypothetical protein
MESPSRPTARSVPGHHGGFFVKLAHLTVTGGLRSSGLWTSMATLPCAIPWTGAQLPLPWRQEQLPDAHLSAQARPVLLHLFTLISSDPLAGRTLPIVVQTGVLFMVNNLLSLAIYAFFALTS